MREVDERPNLLVYALVALAFLVYFFVAATPLPKELALHAVWARNVSKDSGPSAEASSNKLLAFRLGARYGSLAPDGKVAYSRGAPFDVAVSDTAFIPYARDAAVLDAINPVGSSAFQIRGEGWPFYRSGRLFLISPEMNAVSEYSSDGKLLWSYDYPFKISDFDAASSLSVAGLLDGNLECVDKDGKPVFSFAPGGSRIEVILGVALDAQENAIAAVCGADKQRFVLLERHGGTFKVRYHKYLDSDYREPVTVRFSQDGRYVLYRQPNGIAVFDRESQKEALLPVRAQSFEVATDPARGLMFLFAETGRSRAVVCFQPPARIVFSYPLPGGPSWSRYADGSLYLGTGSVLGRIDVSEE
jgi:hypothetical protein